MRGGISRGSGSAHGHHYRAREAFWLTVAYECGKMVMEAVAWILKLVLTGRRPQ